MTAVHLKAPLHHQLSTLNGIRQRLQLLRSTLHQPNVYILPTTTNSNWVTSEPCMESETIRSPRSLAPPPRQSLRTIAPPAQAFRLEWLVSRQSLVVMLRRALKEALRAQEVPHQPLAPLSALHLDQTQISRRKASTPKIPAGCLHSTGAAPEHGPPNGLTFRRRHAAPVTVTDTTTFTSTTPCPAQSTSASASNGLWCPCSSGFANAPSGGSSAPSQGAAESPTDIFRRDAYGRYKRHAPPVSMCPCSSGSPATLIAISAAEISLSGPGLVQSQGPCNGPGCPLQR